MWVTCICLSLCISCQGSCVRVTKCVCVRVNTYTHTLALELNLRVYSFCCLLLVPGSLTASLTMSGNILYVSVFPTFPFLGRERTQNVNEVDGREKNGHSYQLPAKLLLLAVCVRSASESSSSFLPLPHKVYVSLLR